MQLRALIRRSLLVPSPSVVLTATSGTDGPDSSRITRGATWDFEGNLEFWNFRVFITGRRGWGPMRQVTWTEGEAKRTFLSLNKTVVTCKIPFVGIKPLVNKIFQFSSTQFFIKDLYSRLSAQWAYHLTRNKPKICLLLFYS